MLTSATKEDALVLRYIMTYGVKKIPLPQVINNVDNLWIKKIRSPNHQILRHSERINIC